jgi:hypothetical protein
MILTLHWTKAEAQRPASVSHRANSGFCCEFWLYLATLCVPNMILNIFCRSRIGSLHVRSTNYFDHTGINPATREKVLVAAGPVRLSAVRSAAQGRGVPSLKGASEGKFRLFHGGAAAAPRFFQNWLLRYFRVHPSDKETSLFRRLIESTSRQEICRLRVGEPTFVQRCF